MANDNLQHETAPAIPTLALELEELWKLVNRMEELLDGADSILSSIRYEGDLVFTPANEIHVDRHQRACRMIDFLTKQIEAWRESRKGLDDPSDDIWDLMDKAQHGQLIRYGRPVLEPVE